MPFPIEKKFVIAVSSSALFDMKESAEVFQSKTAIVPARNVCQHMKGW